MIWRATGLNKVRRHNGRAINVRALISRIKTFIRASMSGRVSVLVSFRGKLSSFLLFPVTRRPRFPSHFRARQTRNKPCHSRVVSPRLSSNCVHRRRNYGPIVNAVAIFARVSSAPGTDALSIFGITGDDDRLYISAREESSLTTSRVS